MNFQPIYLQVKDSLLEMIRNGDFTVGKSLPSERQIERLFKVSRVSVRKALEELVRIGVVEKSHGKRSIVIKTGDSETTNMAFVTALSKSTLLDVYRILYEALFVLCNAVGVNLVYVDASREIPPFIKKIKFSSVFVSGNVVSHRSFEEIATRGTQIIVLDDIFEDDLFTTVCTDNIGTAARAANYLLALGRKHFLFLGVEPAYHYKPFSERKSAFISTIQNAGAEYRILDLNSGSLAAVQQGLPVQIEKHRCDAIFSLNDHLAINVMTVLFKMGRRIPDDVAVIGFDGLEIGAFSTPTLTTVAQPIEAIAQKAIELACAKDRSKKTTIKLLGDIIRRESA